VPIVICLVAAVILGGVVVVAMGRGGELSRERPELPVRSDFQSWSDVAEYRPPAALLGYHAAATEHALALIARTVAERDAEIDWLRRRLAEFQPESAPDLDADAEPAHSASSGDSARLGDSGVSGEPAERSGAAGSVSGADAVDLSAELDWPAGASKQAETPVVSGFAAHPVHSAHQVLGARASEDE
jgi:hypothetical protein